MDFAFLLSPIGFLLGMCGFPCIIEEKRPVVHMFSHLYLEDTGLINTFSPFWVPVMDGLVIFDVNHHMPEEARNASFD